jgi:hypothetical protein
MTRLDDLPPDQRAALSLLLRSRKSYSEVAGMLQIGPRAVHDRAHAALAVIAPRQAHELTAEQREEIGEYLLDQQPGSVERLRTRRLLEDSPEARAWAGALADALAPLAEGPLPQIPGAERAAPGELGREEEPVASAAAAARGAGAPTGAGRGAPRPGGGGTGRPGRSSPSSRIGGAVLLAVIVAGVIVAVVLIAGNGGGSSGRTASAGAAPSSTGTSATGSTKGKAREDRRVVLRPTDPTSKAIGVAEVLSEGNKYAFYMAAEHLAPSHGFFYAVWLYNSPSSHEPVSKSPPVGADGRLQGGALLPPDAGKYHTMLLTKETSERPRAPGPVVLRGPFGLH